jgi:hypothetical protein
MSFPLHDWQFWVVTALAAAAAAWLIRGLLRFILHTRRGKAPPKRATLTIEGKAAGRATAPPPPEPRASARG